MADCGVIIANGFKIERVPIFVICQQSCDIELSISYEVNVFVLSERRGRTREDERIDDNANLTSSMMDLWAGCTSTQWGDQMIESTTSVVLI